MKSKKEIAVITGATSGLGLAYAERMAADGYDLIITGRREEIIKAAQKASIHDMIMSLPNGYDTEVGELGDTLSGGEKQRIGIARAFLHDSSMLLLDEPTSNLDSLNEGIILKSLKEESKGRTVVLVSHRESTMGIADDVYHMDAGRVS